MSEKDQVQVVQEILRRIDEQKDMKTIQVEKELKKTDQKPENSERNNSQTNKIVMSILTVFGLILILMVVQWKKRKECGRDE